MDFSMEASQEEVNAAVEKAAAAFEIYRHFFRQQKSNVFKGHCHRN